MGLHRNLLEFRSLDKSHTHKSEINPVIPWAAAGAPKDKVLNFLEGHCLTEQF